MKNFFWQMRKGRQAILVHLQKAASLPRSIAYLIFSLFCYRATNTSVVNTVVHTLIQTIPVERIHIFWDVNLYHWWLGSQCLKWAWWLPFKTQAVVPLTIAALCSFKISGTNHPMTLHHIPDNLNPQQCQCCENHVSPTTIIAFLFF